ncbi:MAG: hypothetical protein KGY48_10750 [Wenzhouxiangellaceae bacterium]|jgi:hypothetical protein|nr:hypothetical protein [Wenzhouxiangellaceae bacterium]MBS3747673.1 hypothetical protein [Wenzhouxiangellaceae bacterium]MBS3822707.1 hypothetical protein [Wenzhouxiangellaceae bacterium]
MRIALALLFVASVMTLSTSATADGDKVLLCPDGEDCTVITCGSDFCTVYHCSGGTCTDVGQYPNPNSGGGDGGSESTSLGMTSESGEGTNAKSSITDDQVLPLYGPSPGLSCGSQRCVIKTCNELECSLIGFEEGRAISLGSFKNNDSVVELIAEDFRNTGRESEKQR